MSFARLRTRFAEHRRHQHTATARTPRALTMALKETLSTYWIHLQAALLPWLDEAPDGPLARRPLPSGLHRALIQHPHPDRLVGQGSRDSTAIEPREKPTKPRPPAAPV